MSSHKTEPQRHWPEWIILTILAIIGWLIENLLTRTKIIDKKKTPKSGPVIFAVNHASTYDAMLMRLHMPRLTYTVGPGDFKLGKGGSWVLSHSGIIMAKRGQPDRGAMKKMMNVLNRGGMLGIFPEGGTWEKTVEDVKPGVAYLSAMTGAPIMPVAFGGTYRVWYDIFRFKFPKVTIKYGDLLPPVELSGDRKARSQELQAAAIEIMEAIYDLLPPEDQARYDLVARQRFEGHLEAEGYDLAEDEKRFDGLAELIRKSNMFAVMYNFDQESLEMWNTKTEEPDISLFPAEDLHRAGVSLQKMFAENFVGFLAYRLGEEKEKEILADIDRFVDVTAKAKAAGASLKFLPEIHLIDEDENQSEVSMDAVSATA